MSLAPIPACPALPLPRLALTLPALLLLAGLAACGSDPSPAGTPATDVGTDATDAADAPDAAIDAAIDAAAPDAAADTTGDTADAGKTDWDAAFAHVLPQDHVVDLRLTFAPGTWAQLLADYQQKQVKSEHPAAFSFDGEALAQIGVRLKGLNSLNIPQTGPIDPTARYPLKLDFNSQGGERFHAVDELSLNTSASDPSRMREWLTARMYQSLGVDAAHIAHATVRIDGQAVGPYVLAQAIDKRFLKERFGTDKGADDGNLYKCVYNQFGACSLQWLGNAKADYLRTDACAPGYDDCGLVLQTNEDDPAQNDYKDLIHFLDVLHHTPQDQLQEKLAAVFDVDHFLRLAAVAYATGNFDSYFGKGHNYYLYRRADGRFQMIPWDFDLTYGSANCEADIADPTCGQADGHPLTQKILSVPAWKTLYLGYLRTVVEQWLTPERHGQWIAELDARIGSAVAQDPQPPPGSSYADQIDPQGQADGNLHKFVQDRRTFVLGKLP